MTINPKIFPSIIAGDPYGSLSAISKDRINAEIQIANTSTEESQSLRSLCVDLICEKLGFDPRWERQKAVEYLSKHEKNNSQEYQQILTKAHALLEIGFYADHTLYAPGCSVPQSELFAVADDERIPPRIRANALYTLSGIENLDTIELKHIVYTILVRNEDPVLSGIALALLDTEKLTDDERQLVTENVSPTALDLLRAANSTVRAQALTFFAQNLPFTKETLASVAGAVRLDDYFTHCLPALFFGNAYPDHASRVFLRRIIEEDPILVGDRAILSFSGDRSIERRQFLHRLFGDLDRPILIRHSLLRAFELSMRGEEVLLKANQRTFSIPGISRQESLAITGEELKRISLRLFSTDFDVRKAMQMHLVSFLAQHKEEWNRDIKEVYKELIIANKRKEAQSVLSLLDA